MATTGITTSTFKIFYGEKPKIIGLFSEFGSIEFITKWDKIKKLMTDKTFKEIMVGYFYNHTRDTHKLYNPETKRVIITRDIKWVDWKITNTLETLKMFQEPDKEDLVPGIEEDIITTSKPEDKIPLHVIPDEG